MADMFSFKGFIQHPIMAVKVNRAMKEAQEYIDNQCLFLCQDKIPKDNNILISSGKIHTIIGRGEIRYRTPYARRWYYMPANFEQGEGSGMDTVGRGNYWFHRMVAENKDSILKGAQEVINRNL